MVSKSRRKVGGGRRERARHRRGGEGQEGEGAPLKAGARASAITRRDWSKLFSSASRLSFSFS